MANNYLQFSEIIARLSQPEEAWLKEQLESICVYGEEEYPKDAVPVELADREPDWSGVRFLRDKEDHDPCWDSLGFEYRFHDDPGEGGWGRHLWLYAEECGNPDNAAHLVQKFLKQFRPDQWWSITYATTCSKPRAGEFGGGAIFVTADKIAWQNAYDFVARCCDKFKAAKSPATVITLDQLAKLVEQARQQSSLGGDTCVCVCLPETESIPVTGAVIEPSDDGAVFLMLTGKESVENDRNQESNAMEARPEGSEGDG